VDAAISGQAGACPSRAGLQSFHMDLELSRACWAESPRGRGPIVPHIAGAQQGLKSNGVVPASCGTDSRLGSRKSGVH
jgi:hypothetical protein